jgi:hypothetical protein
VEQLGGDRLRYRLLLRPQATVRPDQVRIVVDAPSGWRFQVVPPGVRVAGATASWAAALDREHELIFELVR